MIKCLAIDDEPLALLQLAKYIEKVPFLELSGKCRSAFEAMDAMRDKPIDAIFIDINMPDLNGMDFVRTMKDPPLVVFTTAYSEYAVEGYKVEAVDYLLKPFGMEDFMHAANVVKKQYDLKHGLPTGNTNIQNDDMLFVKSDYKTLRINIADIRYVEGMSEYLRIYLKGQQRPVIAHLAMKKMEERLPANAFMRIHRSYIINLTQIKELNKNRVIMDDDTSLPIGDNYRETFNSYVTAKFLCK